MNMRANADTNRVIEKVYNTKFFYPFFLIESPMVRTHNPVKFY